MDNSVPQPVPRRRPWYRRSWLWLVGGGLVLWFGIPLFLQPLGVKPESEIIGGYTKLPGASEQPTSKLYNVVIDNAPGVGPRDAPVVIVEFGDFQCPFTQQEEPILKQVLQKYPEAVRLIYRDFPIVDVHNEALAAAEAARCAAQQDKYWPYHDALFANQEGLGTAFYGSLAQSLGFDVVKFNRCRDGHLTLGQVKADFEAGVAAGVTGTPTFFVNGHRITGAIPLDLWDKIIVAAIKEKFNK
ncbi:MAG: DSBA oxidoreductase [Parcubacteria group bacterium GW2011_GWD2_43_10]|uniref:Thioredoxin domain-containing protein n=5 Tax=Candidatus Vebleniibacteriota TaxID=1817921 RepID=A0A1G2Q4I1_9BACT|nr:MAG: DSBA oxidoreductase [Parcubacteria group bacterium GW2011_GWA2_42_80]KKS83391.1 MAG: DSBA oxidoreductase [Parcubacteria group bacterium GW2011_GWD2_43_10]KKS92929.1 MAG: DSBA oxidoreductase [Parcubacteria group bacterium GW2011_GWE2_43_12]KKT13123.1 MAG: DSBA oxidoreductase [Parcubacteria group bacterium GW2011_GWA1_43_27]KKT15496.1 MAG: DSBA oxidoreductase [Parcubacteria group bacterium GW2011_GWF2_43_38]KKT17426.1 MAG: DSBA oxidoreductase [Parcubacteria group bacterium GW2011_GWB1_43